jgi:hypothetical protein
MDRNIKIRLIKLKKVSDFIHLNDIKSIENWCKSNELDIHIQRKRKYVYEHELNEALEKIYINDTRKNHPEDFLDRCGNFVSTYSLAKFSGFTSYNSISSVSRNPYSSFPLEVQELLKAI